MLVNLENYIKVAVDIRQDILAGGGVMHADCETALLEEGSQQVDVWGADWYPQTREIRFESMINISPKRMNRSREIQNLNIRGQVEAVIRRLLAIG